MLNHQENGRGTRPDPREGAEVGWAMAEGTQGKSHPSGKVLFKPGTAVPGGAPEASMFSYACVKNLKVQHIRCWLRVPLWMSQERHLMSKKTSFKSLFRWYYLTSLGQGGLLEFQLSHKAEPRAQVPKGPASPVAHQ